MTVVEDLCAEALLPEPMLVHSSEGLSWRVHDDLPAPVLLPEPLPELLPARLPLSDGSPAAFETCGAAMTFAARIGVVVCSFASGVDGVQIGEEPRRGEQNQAQHGAYAQQ